MAGRTFGTRDTGEPTEAVSYTHLDVYKRQILYRGNFQARALEQLLRNQRIPYLLSGGQSFFEKTEIKDLTSYLRLLANSDDDPAFIRAVSTPKRGVGASTLQALGSYAGERRLSLFAAAFEHGFAQRVQARQLAPLVEFCEFINRLQARAGREPCLLYTSPYSTPRNAKQSAISTVRCWFSLAPAPARRASSPRKSPT